MAGEKPCVVAVAVARQLYPFTAFYSLVLSCLSSLISHLSSFIFHASDLSLQQNGCLYITLPYLPMHAGRRAVVFTYLPVDADMSRMIKYLMETRALDFQGTHPKPYEASIGTANSITLLTLPYMYNTSPVRALSIPRINGGCSSGFRNTYRCLSPSSHHHCEAFGAVWVCPGRGILGCVDARRLALPDHLHRSVRTFTCP